MRTPVLSQELRAQPQCVPLSKVKNNVRSHNACPCLQSRKRCAATMDIPVYSQLYRAQSQSVPLSTVKNNVHSRNPYPCLQSRIMCAATMHIPLTSRIVYADAKHTPQLQRQQSRIMFTAVMHISVYSQIKRARSQFITLSTVKDNMRGHNTYPCLQSKIKCAVTVHTPVYSQR